MTTGERILILRKANGLTQGKLGDKLGVSDKAVSKWETEGGTPDIGVLTTISELFSISLDFLLKGNAVTDGDKQATELISQYIAQEQKKVGNAEAIKTCKRLLSENKIELNDDYLPKYNGDKTAFVSFGVFDENDVSKFSLQGLLKHGLSKVALKYFGGMICFEDAVLSDDVDVYAHAQANYIEAKKNHDAETAKKRAGGYGYMHQATEFAGKNKDWALENLDATLPKYYEAIVWLVDNGATYWTQEVNTNSHYATAKYVEDISKTKFIYRVAKDMAARG